MAARRLHGALRRSGVDSQFFFGAGYTNDPSYHQVFANNSFLRRNAAAILTSWQNRRYTPGGLLRSPGWIRKTSLSGLGGVPDVLNLHDVNGWLDQPTFFPSIPASLPVVWSLHILLPITGGCMYPGECDGFTQKCGSCPQLKKRHPRDASRKYFHFKENWYKKLNLHLVGNSEWTTAQIHRSALANYAKSIRTIHYGIDVDEFRPIEKELAKKALGLDPNKFVIGFACSDFHERRKGAHLLIEALRGLPAREVVLVVLGGGLWPRDAAPCETVVLGSLASPRLQSVYYSALDIFAMPTQVETFGLVAAEAMACGTPVVAYPGGGLADVVIHNETGLVEPKYANIAGFSRNLEWMRKNPVERLGMGRAGRERVVTMFSDGLMASRYLDLYKSIVSAESPQNP